MIQEESGALPPAPRQVNGARTRYGSRRFAILTGAFLLVAINPFINFYLHENFVQGWYQSLGVGKLWFVSPLEGLESLLITKSLYLPSLIGMAIPVTIALFLGRVFCSWLCPISFLLECVDRLRRRVSARPFLKNKLLVAKKVLWFSLIAELIASLVLGAPLFVFLSPPGLVGREIMMAVFFHKLALEGVLIIVVVLLELLTRRFFCRSFCPLGGLLAFLGRKRRLRVSFQPDACVACEKCSKTCPMGLQPTAGEGMSAYCWNCGECVDSCRHDALRFRWL
ncbi:MAG: 4Fe-4S binding protein [Desulforhopalus sp.]|nr:4Fe-4S binding protein [Desulforhopalus sp.]